MPAAHNLRPTDLFSVAGADLAEEASAFLRFGVDLPEADGGRGDAPRRRILLPYADTEPGKHALEATVDLSTALHADVRVLHVRQWDGCRGGRLFLETREESLVVTRHAVKWLQRQGVAASGVVRIARRAYVPDSIIAEAESCDATTIVLAARLRRILVAALVGSISFRVSRRTARPVILLHPPHLG